MTQRDVTTEVARLPLHAEVQSVGVVRRVTARVRVAVQATRSVERIDAPRRRRQVAIARVALDQEVSAPPVTRQEGDTLIIPVVEERLVLVRKLFLVEELRLRLQEEEELVSLTVATRRQQAVVTRVPAGDGLPEPFPSEQRTPSMPIPTTRTITAMFDGRADAERAQQSLLNLGVPDERIRLRAVEGADAGTERQEDRGILAAIADLFLPDDDRATYGEGLRRGGVLLTAELDATMAESAMDALEAAGAVDLDEREQSWRSEGWSPSATAAGLPGGS
jgi:hypothetical protein